MSINGRSYILDRQRGAQLHRVQEGNLYQELTVQTLASLQEGMGQELGPAQGGGVPKSQALHSSAVLVLNVFQYWQGLDEVAAIASACGLCRVEDRDPMQLRFEHKVAVDPSFRTPPPHLDVAILREEGQVWAIESKFTEPYRSPHKSGAGLSEAYKKETLGEDLPSTRSFATCHGLTQHLDVAQLVKHVLGLERSVGRGKYRLCYLYYDVPGPDGAGHRKEVGIFAQAMREDRVDFLSVTYQEVIARLAKRCRDEHPDYIDYITERYL